MYLYRLTTKITKVKICIPIYADKCQFLLIIVKLTLLDSLFWRSRGGRLHQLGGWIKAILFTLGSRPAQRGWDWEWDWHQTWLQEQHSASVLLWPGQPQGSGKAHLFLLFSGRVFLADAEGSVQTHIDGWEKQFYFFIFFHLSLLRHNLCGSEC